MHACGAIRVESRTINHARSVEGGATLECKTEQHQVSGTLKFEGCP